MVHEASYCDQLILNTLATGTFSLVSSNIFVKGKSVIFGIKVSAIHGVFFCSSIWTSVDILRNDVERKIRFFLMFHVYNNWIRLVKSQKALAYNTTVLPRRCDRKGMRWRIMSIIGDEDKFEWVQLNSYEILAIITDST